MKPHTKIPLPKSSGIFVRMGKRKEKERENMAQATAFVRAC